MKRYISFLVFLLILDVASAQVLNPVKWSFSKKELGNEAYELLFKARMDQGWHLYSQDIPEGGPVKTSFSIVKSPHFELINAVSEPKPEEEYDPNFEMKLKYFSHEAIFRQKIKRLSGEPFTIKGSLEFMCCNDEQCLPPNEVGFQFEFAGAPAEETTASGSTTTDTMDNTIVPGNDTVTTDTAFQATGDKSAGDETEGGTKNSGLWIFILISFLAGLAGILTPCVFPMIPMTVTFFLRGSDNRLKAISKALVFGFSIMLIYTLVGVLVSLTSLGADFASTLSTHWLPNSIFFLLFLVFAASFFGMFEMILPGSLSNKTDQQADKGGYIGAFFMGLTTVIVSFACTGPIVGALLVEAAGGEVLKPILGMFAFGLAFSLPFTLLAMFPSWLKSMPKSGGWLNSVKIVLGLIVLAFGLKFLSNLDQNYHLGILSRDLYLAIWIVIFTIMGLYLLGIIRFAHDSGEGKITFMKLLLALASLSFVVYLIPGLFGAPLNSISGLIPPATSQVFNLNRPSEQQAALSADVSAGLCDKPKYDDIFHLPYGLTGYFDYRQGLDCAKKLNKPIFLDFKGHSCSNCKKVEAKLWSDPRVQQLLQEYLIIALYVDDRTELPENEWITSTADGKIKKTIGKKNLDMEITTFGINSQPYYVLLDTFEKKLTDPIGYNVNLTVDGYISFLEKGLENFRARQPQAEAK